MNIPQNNEASLLKKAKNGKKRQKNAKKGQKQPKSAAKNLFFLNQ